ncbi:hypothetical protein GQ54DRAFT_192124 [Martensiomyces pterosporus]|nr:hypothetical protein GQ54DRAFT_192124 [Martensiomyces pterosporus]
MAVEYIQDLQDINAALAEENIRLGGSGNIPLPSRRPSEDSKDISTAPQSPMEDEEMLESASVSPRIAPTAAARARARRLMLPRTVGRAVARRGPFYLLAALLALLLAPSPRPQPPLTHRRPPRLLHPPPHRPWPWLLLCLLSTPGQSHQCHSCLPHPFWPSSPQSLPWAAPCFRPRRRRRSHTAQLLALLCSKAPTSSSTRGNGYVPSTTPMLPPIGPTASSSRLSPTAAAPGAHAATLPPPPPQAQFQFPHAAMHYASKPPAQSMPNSPNFQSYTGGRLSSDFSLGQRAANNSSAIGSHPFFTNGGTHDIPSIRHHLHASSGSKQSGVYSPPNGQHQQLSPAYQQQQNAAGLPVRKNSFNPQQYRQHPYAQNSPAHVPVAQSLQNTPLMRPSRESLLGEGFELPPINFNNRIVLPPPQQQQQQQGQQGQQQQR